MATKRMGGMKLGDFGKTDAAPPKAVPVESEPLPAPEPASTIQKHPPVATPKEKPITVNIKITRIQHDWLNETSRQVRENNDEPVPAADRVYPQHLIGVALDLLKGADIDWGTVANVQDLRKQLNI
jgi:hypothetical protein